MSEKFRAEEAAVRRTSEKENTPEGKLEALPRSDAIVVCGGELKRNKKGKVVAGIESKMRALGAF